MSIEESKAIGITFFLGGNKKEKKKEEKKSLKKRLEELQSNLEEINDSLSYLHSFSKITLSFQRLKLLVDASRGFFIIGNLFPQGRQSFTHSYAALWLKDIDDASKVLLLGEKKDLHVFIFQVLSGI